MTLPQVHGTSRPTPSAVYDPRDLARRVVAAGAASAGLAGILAGRPLLSVLERSALVLCAGILLIAGAEAIVRRVKRRVVP
jgi:hypothetical protein